jgi:hypothetical protein
LNKLLGGLSVTELFQVPNEMKNCFQLTDGIQHALMDAATNLKGNDRRIFMAKTVQALGHGGQRLAEENLHWNRATIRKGMHELQSGIKCCDYFNGRGRYRIETHLPNLLKDITGIVKPGSQADPTFRTIKLYTPITADNIYQRLIEEKGYTVLELPTIRTIGEKMNNLNFHQQTVAKCLPKKKIKETDAIFDEVHRINREADSLNGVLRLSMDSKAKIKGGLLSRGGKSRQEEKALDHDFEPEWILSLFGIFLPFYDQSYFYFSQEKDTADFMIDCLEKLWPTLKLIFDPHTLVINLDNGPENSSHRTQFIKRIVGFAHDNYVNIKLAYYPPYHSKYNSIERVWGILENHWSGEILCTIEKTLGMASSMTYNMIHPEVELIGGEYPCGVKLDKKDMRSYEDRIHRMCGLEDWFVDIIARPTMCKTIFDSVSICA